MDINQILTENPARIASKSHEAEEARLIWQQAREHQSLQEAKQALLFKAGNPKLTATEIKHMVAADKELYEGLLNLTVLESKCRKIEIDTDKLKDEFTSAKVLARIQIAEMNNLNTGGLK